MDYLEINTNLCKAVIKLLPYCDHFDFCRKPENFMSLPADIWCTCQYSNLKNILYHYINGSACHNFTIKGKQITDLNGAAKQLLRYCTHLGACVGDEKCTCGYPDAKSVIDDALLRGK